MQIALGEILVAQPGLDRLGEGVDIARQDAFNRRGMVAVGAGAFDQQRLALGLELLRPLLRCLFERQTLFDGGQKVALRLFGVLKHR